jgi:endonuclease G
LSKEYKDVYVVTGPLFLPTKEGSKWFVKYQVLGNPPNVAVPTHFYKLVLAVSGPKEHVVGAFVIPNSKVVETTPLEFFSVSFEDLEKMAGVSFFDQLKHKGITFKPLCAQSKCILPPTTFWQKGAKSPTPSAPRRTELAEIDPAILDDEAS